MSKVRSIIKLYAQGASKLSIGERTQLPRNTVRRYIHLFLASGLSLEDLDKLDDKALEQLFLDMSSREHIEDDPRYLALKELFPEIDKKLRQRGITKEMLWKEYFEKHPDGYRVSQFKAHFLRWKRASNPTMHIDHKAGEKMYVDYAGEKLHYLDVFTGERRMTTVEDIELHTKVSESLGNVDFVMPMGSATNVANEISDIYEFISTVKYTLKPIPFITWNKKNLKTVIEIASIFSGSMDNLVEKPFIIQFSEPTSPLTHTKDAVDKLLYSAEIGIPVAYFPCNTLGGTGPMSIYGSIVQSNAESLMGLVMSQLKREGAPFIIGGCGIPLNMSNGLLSVGSPEYYLTMSAYAAVCQYYKIPMFGLGSQSDSKVIDEQAAIEMTLHTLMSALAGINMIDGLAQLESCILGSIEMVVLSDEVIEIIKRLINGVDTGSDKEIRKLINEVGPGGQYVSQEHTLNNFKSAWFPTLFDRNNFSRWKQEGSLDLKQRLNKKTRDIIDNYQMEDLSKETMGGINQIMAQYNNFSSLSS